MICSLKTTFYDSSFLTNRHYQVILNEYTKKIFIIFSQSKNAVSSKIKLLRGLNSYKIALTVKTFITLTTSDHKLRATQEQEMVPLFGYLVKLCKTVTGTGPLQY